MPRPPIVDIINQLPRKPEKFVRRSIGSIRIIAVHFDAENVVQGQDSLQRYIGQANFHISKNWNIGPDGKPRLPAIRGFGLMYHYKINPAGTIFQTQPESLITWNANLANPIDLAVCMDLGDSQHPTQAQLQSLEKLLDWFCFERPDFPAGQKNVFGHGEMTWLGNNTNCPGNFLSFVKNYRNKPPVVTPPPPPPQSRLFVETGQRIQGMFKDFFEANGDVPIFGLPLTPEMIQLLEDGNDHRVQWFERARLELHGPNVILGRVGVEALEGRHAISPQTGVGILPEFQNFYDANGGLPIFGLPITDKRTDKLEDGKKHTIQWFERSRFELHAAGVLLGRVGAEALSTLNNSVPAAAV